MPDLCRPLCYVLINSQILGMAVSICPSLNCSLKYVTGLQGIYDTLVAMSKPDKIRSTHGNNKCEIDVSVFGRLVNLQSFV